MFEGLNLFINWYCSFPEEPFLEFTVVSCFFTCHFIKLNELIFEFSWFKVWPKNRSLNSYIWQFARLIEIDQWPILCWFLPIFSNQIICFCKIKSIFQTITSFIHIHYFHTKSMYISYRLTSFWRNNPK